MAMDIREISHLVIIGDSLTDRGHLARDKLFGMLPMAKLAGLEGTSPLGRFGNGLSWADILCIMLSNRWIIEKLRESGIDELGRFHGNAPDSMDLSDACLTWRAHEWSSPSYGDLNDVCPIKYKHFFKTLKQVLPEFVRFYEAVHQPKRYNSADLADAVLHHDRHLKKVGKLATKSKFEMKNRLREYVDISDAIIAQSDRIAAIAAGADVHGSDLEIRYQGEVMASSFDKGGMTSHNWAGRPSLNPKRFFTRIILPKLDKRRGALFSRDEALHTSKAHKAHRLVIEWSGANDLITVNAKPTVAAADLAVDARIRNIEKLIQAGDCNFVLFDMPDLSLTPRYQAKNEVERKNAHDCSVYFNTKLAKGLSKIEKRYPHCSIDIFRVSELFQKIYDNPESYGFDREKLTKPYLDSEDFAIRPDDTSPASRYAFYDDVHFSADAQVIVAHTFLREVEQEYRFKAPSTVVERDLVHDLDEDSLLYSFREAYERKWNEDRKGFLGFFRKSKIYYPHASLDDIFRHAFYENGGRTRKVLEQLRWIDKEGALDSNIPLLSEVKARVDEQVARVSSGLVPNMV